MASRARSPSPGKASGNGKRGEWSSSLYKADDSSIAVRPGHKEGGGGIKIDPQEIKMAFEFFDTSKKGVLKVKDLKARLSAFYPNMSSKEYQFLLGDSGQDFTLDSLMTLLSENDISNFDPVKEAFKVFDVDDSGFVNEEVLKGIMTRLGYGEISADDMSVLIRAADSDGDGRISLNDFRGMMKSSANLNLNSSLDPKAAEAASSK